MQVNRVQNNPSFGINVSTHFSKTVQNFYNYGNVPNKRNLIWKFNQKVEQYSKFGYEDYSLDYEKKLQNGNWEHFLTATRNDGKKVVLFHRSRLDKIIDRFMQMNKHELDTKFPKNR